MSIIVRRVVWGVWAGMLAWGCAAEDDGGTGDPQGSDTSSTAPVDDSTGATTANADDTSSSGSSGEVSSGDPPASESSSGDGSTSEADSGSSGSETAAQEVWDEEFVWVADFLRANCVKCHATGVNGNLLLPDAMMTNDEVRLALDGVVATTGLQLVEPGDREQSQTWLQITNEFGAIFPVEETDRFGAWIDAGALYYAE